MFLSTSPSPPRVLTFQMKYLLWLGSGPGPSVGCWLWQSQHVPALTFQNHHHRPVPWHNHQQHMETNIQKDSGGGMVSSIMVSISNQCKPSQCLKYNSINNISTPYKNARCAVKGVLEMLLILLYCNVCTVSENISDLHCSPGLVQLSDGGSERSQSWLLATDVLHLAHHHHLCSLCLRGQGGSSKVIIIFREQPGKPFRKLLS